MPVYDFVCTRGHQNPDRYVPMGVCPPCEACGGETVRVGAADLQVFPFFNALGLEGIKETFHAHIRTFLRREVD